MTAASLWPPAFLYLNKQLNSVAASVLWQRSILLSLCTSRSFDPKGLGRAELKPALVLVLMEMVPIWTLSSCLEPLRWGYGALGTRGRHKATRQELPGEPFATSMQPTALRPLGSMLSC